MGGHSIGTTVPEAVPEPLTVDGDGSQDEPGRPLGQVLDEDEGHEGADEDEVGLLQLQGPLPVDADHPHGPEVPDKHPDRRVVHRQVVGLKHFAGRGGTHNEGLEPDSDPDSEPDPELDSPQVHGAEGEEQHEGGQDEPAVDELDPKHTKHVT